MCKHTRYVGGTHRLALLDTCYLLQRRYKPRRYKLKWGPEKASGQAWTQAKKKPPCVFIDGLSLLPA